MVDQRTTAVAAAGRLRQRARYAVANAPTGAAIAAAWQSALAGSGLKPQSLHPDPDTRSALNLAFEAWTDRADHDGLGDFYALQGVVARRMPVDGEAFVLLGADPDSGELRLRVLDADLIDSFHDRTLEDGERVVAGVAFNARDQRTGYYVSRDPHSLDRVRLDAADVCHCFKVEHPNQIRGLTWLGAILLRLADWDKLSDAQVVRQQISACLAGFIVNPNGDQVPPQFADGAPDGLGGLIGGLEPATLKVLAPGEDIRFSDPADIGPESVDFMRLTLKEIAAGCGLPYALLSGDLSDANYSSARVGLIEFRRKVEALQYATLVWQLSRKVWRRWISLEALAGRIDSDAFARNPEPFLAAKWLCSKNLWVDPLKDAQAEREAIAAGLLTRREALAERGWDIEQVDREIAEDNARAAALGLNFAAPSPAAQGVAP
jgi:lambda family phage portal protein